jgi:hypothetical protein
MRPILLTLAALAVSTLPAAAQIQPLPETSRSEAQSNALNNALVREGQSRGVTEQNQFEINALRNQSSRAVSSPPIVVAPPIAGPGPVNR